MGLGMRLGSYVTMCFKNMKQMWEYYVTTLLYQCILYYHMARHVQEQIAIAK